MTEILHADEAGLARAAELLREGALVAFPTETVYGLGADATDDHAVARIYEAKGRPRFNPLIAHVPDLAAADRLAVIEGAARVLAEKFWPGPLTLVVPRRDLAGEAEPGLSADALRQGPEKGAWAENEPEMLGRDIAAETSATARGRGAAAGGPSNPQGPATAGQDQSEDRVLGASSGQGADADARSLSHLLGTGLPTVAIRVPALEVTRRLLRAVGRPVAGPSANPSGRVSPTTAAHVLAGLDGKIAAVLDAGPCSVGVESTIVGFDAAGQPLLLRPGGLAAEEIEAALGQSLGTIAPSARPNSPGQLSSHYAPEAPLRLDVVTPAAGETLIGFGAVRGDVSLSESGDLVEAAARLFGLLREMDRPGVRLAVAPIPAHGLGRAIRDRLARAAAPRP